MAKKIVKKTSTVKKEGNAELAAILADIQSLLKQLTAAEQAEGTEEVSETDDEDQDKAVRMSAQGESAEIEDPDEDVDKDETGNSNAEDRIEEEPDETTDALAAIGKTLLALQGKTVAKSASTVRTDKTTKILASIAKSLDAINRRVATNEEALVGIMEGIGVADLVQKSVETAPKKVVQDPNTKAFVDMLAAALVQKSGPSAPAEEDLSLGDAMLALAGSAPNKQ